MTKIEKIGLKWLNDNYSNLEIYTTEKQRNIIFYMKNGKYIYHYNTKNGVVYINYYEIWSFLESYFGMNIQQIRDLTKVWVEEQYKLGVTTTARVYCKYLQKVEEQYKLGVTTTEEDSWNVFKEVEEQYKLGVTTTSYNRFDSSKMVEEQYKLGVTTTHHTMPSNVFWVEEQYQNEITTIN